MVVNGSKNGGFWWNSYEKLLNNFEKLLNNMENHGIVTNNY